jgi:urease accessory protein
MNSGKNLALRCACVFSALTLAASPALAHTTKGLGIGFISGFTHPLTGIDHILAMVAVGIWGTQLGKPASVSLAVGAVLGIPIHPPSVVGWINLGSMAGLGLLVATARPLPPSVTAALSLLLGLAIGLANGAELAGQVSPSRFVPGLALTGLMLVTYGIGCARRLRAPWVQIGFRVLGSWIAAVGILVLSLK